MPPAWLMIPTLRRMSKLFIDHVIDKLSLQAAAVERCSTDFCRLVITGRFDFRRS